MEIIKDIDINNIKHSNYFIAQIMRPKEEKNGLIVNNITFARTQSQLQGHCSYARVVYVPKTQYNSATGRSLRALHTNFYDAKGRIPCAKYDIEIGDIVYFDWGSTNVNAEDFESYIFFDAEEMIARKRGEDMQALEGYLIGHVHKKTQEWVEKANTLGLHLIKNDFEENHFYSNDKIYLSAMKKFAYFYNENLEKVEYTWGEDIIAQYDKETDTYTPINDYVFIEVDKEMVHSKIVNLIIVQKQNKFTYTGTVVAGNEGLKGLKVAFEEHLDKIFSINGKSIIPIKKNSIISIL